MQAARPLVFASKGMELNVNTHHFLRHEEQEFQMLPIPFKMIIFEGVPQGPLEINVANLIGTGPIRRWKTLDNIFYQLEQKYGQTNTVLIQGGGGDTKTCE